MASTSDQQPQLEVRLTYLLKSALLDLEDVHTEHLAPVGISGRELGVLLLLATLDATSQLETAERLRIDRTTMVGLLDGLEAKELVARRPDARDRRRNVLELTEQGRTTLATAVRASDEAEEQFLARLEATESKQLRALLVRLAEHQRPS